MFVDLCSFQTVCVCVCASENLSPHVSPDEFDIAEHQQLQSSPHSDSDDEYGLVDGQYDDPTETRHNTEPHHHLDHHPNHHEDGHLPAAEPRHLRDIAVQVNDMTRRSTSSQVCYLRRSLTFLDFWISQKVQGLRVG